jgi:hypothetical protein
VAGVIDKAVHGDVKVDFDVLRLTEEWRKVRKK